MSRYLLIFCVLIFVFKFSFALNNSDTKRASLNGSINSLLKSNKAEKIKSYTLIAGNLINKKEYKKALSYLIKAKNLNPEDSVHLRHYNMEFGRLFAEIGAYQTAIDYELKIYRSATKANDKFFPVSSIAILYLKLNQADSSLFYYKILYEKVAIPMGDFMAESSALNNQGCALLSLKRYKEALAIFEHAISIYESNKHKKSKYFNDQIKSFYFELIENRGRSLYYLKNYKEAIRFLELSTVVIRPELVSENNHILVLSYLNIGEVEKAEKLVNLLKAKSDKNDIRIQKKLHEILCDYYIKRKFFGLIEKELLQIDDLSEKIEQSDYLNKNQMSLMISSYLLNEASENIKLEIIKKKLISGELSLEKKRKFIYLFSSILLFLLLLSVVYVRLQNFKNKKKTLELETEKLSIDNKMQAFHIKKQELYLSEYALDFNKNKEYDQTLIKSLSQIVATEKEQQASELKSLLVELKQKQFVLVKTENLINESEIAMVNFKTNLLNKHPGITKTDVQLCYFLRLDLSNKEIATLKNVTTDSIKIFKNRLKNKFGITANQSIENYLKSI